MDDGASHAFGLCGGCIDFAHVPMMDGGHLAIIPRDCNRSPTRCGDSATVAGITSPAYPIACLEFPRLVSCHVAPLLSARAWIRFPTARVYRRRRKRPRTSQQGRDSEPATGRRAGSS